MNKHWIVVRPDNYPEYASFSEAEVAAKKLVNTPVRNYNPCTGFTETDKTDVIIYEATAVALEPVPNVEVQTIPA